MKKHISIYNLIAYEFIEDMNENIVLLEDNVSVKLDETLIGSFFSVKKAEAAIKKLVAFKDEEIKSKWSKYPYFGFSIVEMFENEPFYGNRNISMFKSYRTYLPNGELNCLSDLDDSCEKKFTGTTRSSRFKKGSFAWILHGTYATPTMIEKEAFTKEYWKKHFSSKAFGDYIDDSGIDFPYSVDYCGHQHTRSVLLFPTSKLLKIPAFAKDTMRKAKKTWIKYGVMAVDYINEKQA